MEITSLVNAILTFNQLLKEARQPNVASWQPLFITQCTDWCIFIETELASLSNEERQNIRTRAQQDTKDILPSINQLLDAHHYFFKVLLRNVFLSNDTYLYIMKNYRFLNQPEQDVLMKARKKQFIYFFKITRIA